MYFRVETTLDRKVINTIGTTFKRKMWKGVNFLKVHRIEEIQSLWEIKGTEGVYHNAKQDTQKKCILTHGMCALSFLTSNYVKQ